MSVSTNMILNDQAILMFLRDNAKITSACFATSPLAPLARLAQPVPPGTGNNVSIIEPSLSGVKLWASMGSLELMLALAASHASESDTDAAEQ